MFGFVEIIGLATHTVAGKMSAAQCIAVDALGTASTHAATDFDAAGSAAAAQSAAQASSLQKADNLSDLTSATSARANLGLGTAAELNAGVANGVPTLDGSGHVPTSQLPPAIVGALQFQGTWNASTNSPTLTSSTGTKGYAYVVGTAGTTTLDGISTWNGGDLAVFDGTVWRKIDGTSTDVLSFNGRTGTVSPQSGDYTASQVGLGNVTNDAQLKIAGNLSDLANAATARTNLGLGSAATQASSAFDAAGAAATAQSNAEAYAANGSHISGGTVGAAYLAALGAAGGGHAAGIVPDPGSTSHATPYLLGDDAAWHQLAAGTNVTITYSGGTYTIAASGGGGGGGGGSSSGSLGSIQYADGSGGFLGDSAATDGAGNWLATSVTSSGSYWSINSVGAADFASLTINGGTSAFSVGNTTIVIQVDTSDLLAFFGGSTAGRQSAGSLLTDYTSGSPGSVLTFPNYTNGMGSPYGEYVPVNGTGDDYDVNNNFANVAAQMSAVADCLSSLIAQVNYLTGLLKTYNLGS